MNNPLNILEDLSLLSAPSTRETPVQKWLAERLGKLLAVAHGDSQGNLWATTGTGHKIRCGIIAHADEIGIQLSSVEEPGIGRFRKIGGLRASSLIGQYVLFTAKNGEQIKGLIGSDPMQNNGTDNGLIVKTSDLWVDIGAESAEEFLTKISIGDFATFLPRPIERLSENRLVGKAFDDRCGLAASLCAFEQLAASLKNVELSIVSSVQEELNLFGAKALPLPLDIAIVVDVDFAADTPSAVADVTNLSLGKGIGICVNADNNPVLLEMLREECALKNIPIQPTVGRNFSGGTDAAALRLKNTATLNISIPLRYMHTALEMLDCRDLKWAVEAIVAIVKKIDQSDNIDSLVPWKN